MSMWERRLFTPSFFLLIKVIYTLYECKSEVIGPGLFRFEAKIDFIGVVPVQNYSQRTGRGELAKQMHLYIETPNLRHCCIQKAIYCQHAAEVNDIRMLKCTCVEYCVYGFYRK